MMKQLTLDEYQKKAMLTAKFTQNEGLAYTALALNEEAGEYAGKFAKEIRDKKFNTIDAAFELGDILWNVAAAAHYLGFTLEKIAEMNLEKLADRQLRGMLKGSGDNR